MSDAVLISTISTIGGVIVAGIGYLGVRLSKLDTKVDGRLTELLNITAASQRAQGHLEGVKSEQDKKE